MKKKKLFLAQVVIEIDVSDMPDFDEHRATMYFKSALKLGAEAEAQNLNIFFLSDKPAVPRKLEAGPVKAQRDAVIEEYQYRDFLVKVWQAATSIGTYNPRYFGTAHRIGSQTGTLVKDCSSDKIDIVKKAAEAYVDRRMTWRRR